MREMCESCRETYKEENIFDCPHCAGSYCWRCKDAHIARCGKIARELAEARARDRDRD